MRRLENFVGIPASKEVVTEINIGRFGNGFRELGDFAKIGFLFFLFNEISFMKLEVPEEIQGARKHGERSSLERIAQRSKPIVPDFKHERD